MGFLQKSSWGLLNRLKILCTLLKSAKIFHYRQAHSDNFQNFDFFDQLPTLTNFLAEPSAAAPLCGAARSAASSGGGISALGLVRSIRSCAMPAKSVFVLKTKVSCPAAASGGFVRPKNGSRSEVGQKGQNLESSQNGLAYSGKS